MSGTHPTGSERVLEFLRDRRWHTLAEIEHECHVEGRSRLSDLRRQGHVLERRRNHDGFGKAKYSHRLVQTALERRLQDAVLDESEEAVPSVASDSSSTTFIAGSSSTAPYHGDERPPAVDPLAAGGQLDHLEDEGWRDLFDAQLSHGGVV